MKADIQNANNRNEYLEMLTYLTLRSDSREIFFIAKNSFIDYFFLQSNKANILCQESNKTDTFNFRFGNRLKIRRWMLILTKLFLWGNIDQISWEFICLSDFLSLVK